ncbi:MAG: hypothetical protein EBX81_02710 [bacterium]|nr:hypothetical protein [Candidatus Aquidulcis sp.]
MAQRCEGYHQRVISGPLLLARALLANVRFAVLQIGVIALASTIGIALRQLPDYALQNAGDYANEMARLRAEYEPTLGPLVGIFERLGLFRVFTSPWFTALLVLLTVSIIVCTWDRLPKIAAATAPSRPEQPDTFFSETLPGRGVIDLPSPLPTSADLGGRAHAAAAEAKRSGWEVSIAAAPDHNGGLLLHADRFRRSGRFTLVMHTGLVVMLLAAAASGIFGYTQGILLTDGEALPVGKIGTADGLVIVNHEFSAPRTSTGAFADFSTDLRFVTIQVRCSGLETLRSRRKSMVHRMQPCRSPGAAQGSRCSCVAIQAAPLQYSSLQVPLTRTARQPKMAPFRSRLSSLRCSPKGR